MTTKQKEIFRVVATVFLGVSFIAFPALAAVDSPKTKEGEVKVNIADVFDASFDFFRDTNPDPNDPDLGERISGRSPRPSLVFDLAWDKKFDDVIVGGRTVKMPRALGAKEIYRVLVGVINNTKNSYTISHSAAQLTSASGTLPDGAYTVSAFVDPGDGRNTNIGTGLASTQATKANVLYRSDGNGTGTVVQIVYAISSGFDEFGQKRGGVDASKLITIAVPKDTYSGDLTITVDLAR